MNEQKSFQFDLNQIDQNQFGKVSTFLFIINNVLFRKHPMQNSW